MTPQLTLAPQFATASNVDIAASHRLGSLVRAVPRQAYSIALKALQPDMRYGEGYRVGFGTLIPFEHGWLMQGKRSSIRRSPSLTRTRQSPDTTAPRLSGRPTTFGRCLQRTAARS